MLKCVLLIICLSVVFPAASSAQMDPCEDLSAIDFGACAAILGWGVIGDTCQLISGCSSPVPLFATQQECEATCAAGSEPTCEDLSAIDFGPCDAILGFGVVGLDCVAISGCESPVVLFASLMACIQECSSVPVERLSWGTVKARYE